MSESYLSEIRMTAFNYAPRGWALCNGQLLSIGQNTALFSLIGTTYGGNGVQNFALPNLQGRVPMHMGNGFALGSVSGEEQHTLTVSEMPRHNHTMKVNATTASAAIPSSTRCLGAAQSVVGSAPFPQVSIYAPAANNGAFNPAVLSTAGNNQPHENRQPYLVLSFCISLSGIFPSRN